MAVLNDVLVVNAGSTSLKLSIVGADEESHPVDSLESAPDVRAVGHRIVHGGERFAEPTLVDEDVLSELEGLVELAPLHNAPALAAIAAARLALPNATHVAVFDTAFHRTLPAVARTYLLPERYRARGIHRFGFHGLSVAWAASQVAVPRLVVCHLGGGASVTAVRDGASVDTTMGFTPLEGVPMATRAGPLDPGALLFLLRHGVSLEELDRALEHESGMTALAGTGDVAELERAGTPEAGSLSTSTATGSRRLSPRWRSRSAASTRSSSRPASESIRPAYGPTSAGGWDCSGSSSTRRRTRRRPGMPTSRRRRRVSRYVSSPRGRT